MSISLNLKKVLNFKSRILTISILLLMTVGCARPSMLVNEAFLSYAEPEIRKGSVPIAFHRLILDVPSGKPFGGHFDGLLRIREDTYYWQESISIGSEVYNIEASRELRNYGYNVLGSENILFGQDDSAKARYQLGGTLKDISFNTYAPLAGGFSESQVFITWELFDTLNQNVIFEFSTYGYAKCDGVGVQAIFNAFKHALRELMVHPENEYPDLGKKKK